MADCCGEALAHFAQQFIKLLDMRRKLANPQLNILGLLFDLEAAQPLQYRLQICQEAGWAHDNHPSIAKGILTRWE